MFESTLIRDNRLTPTLELLNELEGQYGNSFYLFSSDRFSKNLHNFRDAFKQVYSNVKLGYSFKTNYLPEICRLARRGGAMAEVVSGMEYELARRTGYPGDQIIFNGPLKQKDELFRAFQDDSVIHFDAFHEIEILKDFLADNPDKNVRVALRCNFDIDEGEVSRFGFDAENGDAGELYAELFALDGCKPVGVHCHYSTGHRSLDSFRTRTLKLAKFASRIFNGHHLDYIDIGGGFFGEMPEKIEALFPYEIPSFEDYGKAVGQIMKENFPDENVTLLLEPGASVVANTMWFVCKVACIKQVRSQPMVTLTGGLHNVRPTGTHQAVPFRTIKANSGINNLSGARIGGYTCMENDIIDDSFSGDLAEGDYLIFDNMGAYNIVFKPPFIKGAPPILRFGEGEKGEGLHFEEIRRRETIGDIFSSYKF